MREFLREPWSAIFQTLPEDATRTERLQHLVRFATMAPSTHNTQPWRFKVTDSAIELFEDTSRALSVLDPIRRELTISCGAAAGHLGTAMRHFGHEPRLEWLPDPARSQLLARIEQGAPCPASRLSDRLFYSLARQRSNHLNFGQRKVPGSVRDALVNAVVRPGVWCEVVDDAWKRDMLAGLVSEGDEALFSDPAFLRELAAWTRMGPGRRVDGLPPHVLGLGRVASYVAPIALRLFDYREQQARLHRQQIVKAPLLIMLGTPNDDARAWLTMGYAFADLLLRAYAEGLSVAFMNQPLHVVTLRRRIADWLPRHEHPQMLLRIGYGLPIDPLPRRSLRDILVTSHQTAPVFGDDAT